MCGDSRLFERRAASKDLSGRRLSKNEGWKACRKKMDLAEDVKRLSLKKSSSAKRIQISRKACLPVKE